ncbi:MAG: hypothetical protein GY906_11235, partial [bacterium]|nr:hypothetical protein [bacterium]
MTDDPKLRFRLSTGKRNLPQPGRRSRAILWVSLLMIVAFVTYFELQRQPPEQVLQEPAPTAARAAAPSPTPSPSPTETPFWELATTEVEIPTPTPTTMPTNTPTPRPSPTPDRGVLDCVDWSWSASTSRAAWGQILISVDLSNRCGRPLEPGAIWFNIVAYRDGSIVQTQRGNL